MAAVHRIIANHRNDLSDAVITANAVKSSTDIRLVSTTQTGNATVTLSGPYTGAADATIDVEILDITTATTPRVSAPAFSGAGNGVMTIGAVTPSSPAQTITVKLTDTGILTAAASLDFDEVVLQAKASGDAGNGIQISIDRAGLTFTTSTFSLLRPLSAGAETLEGPEYEWSTVASRSDGAIPDTAKRVTFGDDPTIYRQWKSYSDGGWKYHLHPALERDMPKGTAIVFVTGGREVTVSQGATSEVYTGIITPYDLLSALQNNSDLIEVVGVVTPDKQPGGMGMRELRARTDAHALPTTGEGSAYAKGFTGIAVGETAGTELIQATCWAISGKDYPSAALGKEVWRVAGSVSGVLSTHFRTGDKFSGAAAGVEFTIPQRLPDGYGLDDVNQRGRFRLQSISYAAREDNSEPPPICASTLVLGVAATDKTLTCVYTKRPGTDCDCNEVKPLGRLNPECLGLDFDEDTNMATDAGYIARLQALEEWHSTFTRANTEITAAGELRSAELDLQLADLAHDALLACLEDIYASATTTKALWEAAWTSALTTVDADLLALESIGAAAAVGIPPIAISTAYTAGAAGWLSLSGAATVDPPFTSQIYARCVISGTTGATPGYGGIAVYPATLYPAPTVGDTIPLGTSSWLIITKEEAALLKSGDAGDINSSGSIVDDPGISYTPEIWAKRVTAACNVVRAIGGLPPKKGRAGTAWNPCWSDDGGDDYYWAINGTEYKPAFTNKIYHSCMTCCSSSGQEEVFPTNEFAFALLVKCPEQLMEGDTVTLVIGESGWPATYQVGDVLTLPVIAAAPLELAGGIDGTDTLTWSVNSSTAGALPPYALSIATPAAYTSAAAQFTITPGAISFAAGDAFMFAIEGGHLRWRRDSGSWSATVAVAASHSLGDGLTLGFAAGPPPGLVAGDSWRWQVTQPYAPAAIDAPVIGEAFEWTGSSVTLHADLGAIQAIPAVMIALHTLPLTATVTLAFSTNDTTWTTQAVPVQAGPMLVFPVGKSAQYLELRITGATGARIGWWWVGTPFRPSHNASTLTLSRVYGMARGAGLNPAALYRGAGRAGELAWDAGGGSWLEPADMAEFLALLDQTKVAGDEPFAICPNVALPSETALVVANGDEVKFEDVLSFQAGASRRFLSASIPLRAVIE